jgi:hypothetical protein
MEVELIANARKKVRRKKRSIFSFFGPSMARGVSVVLIETPEIS